MKIRTILIMVMIVATCCSGEKKYVVTSPDKEISLTIIPRYNSGDKISPAFAVKVQERQIIHPSSIVIETDKNIFEGNNIKVNDVERESVTDTWINMFGERKEVPDNYNQMKIFMEARDIKINLICRAYNEGIAFSYEFPEQDEIDSLTIRNEKITFAFQSDYFSWSAPRAQAQYSKVPVSKIDKGSERPLVIEIDTSMVIALAEAKLIDYARMKFYPDSIRNYNVITQLGSVVHKFLPFQSPWRVVMIGRSPGDLLEKNYLILNLNDPCAIDDVSWIRPGKALREVTLTTAGAKAAIDFTSSHNMQYVEFDAGWYGPENNDNSDARAVNLDPARSNGPLDMEEVISYAKSKDIDILLYVNRRALEKQLDELLPLYRDWGVAGIKFGFVQVGTQDATRWLHESIMKLAKYKMVADVHDEYRPTGFSRTYPNFLTMEGIRGDEESPSNHHTLITMFTRMLAGQGDNTICYYNERVDKKMGSHASQLAKAVCIFSPLQFLYWYDKAAPALKKDDGLWGDTNYIGNEPELEFFDNVPTVWDETRVLHAKIGEYGIIARKKDNEWFIGGINGEKSINLDLSFGFLDPDKQYDARIYTDDPSVNTRTHVRVDSLVLDSEYDYKLTLNSNNGFAINLKPVNHGLKQGSP